ncbi:MAG: hypothetical protein VYE73_12710 [Acidobacteriota bacterium]|nr:hypothetical protein [Acidobacteriota bacterium]
MSQSSSSPALPIVCLALMSSTVVYAVLAWLLLSGQMGEGEAARSVAAVPWLPGGGVALLLLGSLIGRRFRRLPEHSAVQGTIVTFACYEGAAIIGLVTAIATYQVWWAWGLSFAALAAMALAWPSKRAT